MICSEVTQTRSIYFTVGDLFDNLNERQRDYLRHVLQCRDDLSDVFMLVTSDGRLCLWCDSNLNIEEELF